MTTVAEAFVNIRPNTIDFDRKLKDALQKVDTQSFSQKFENAFDSITNSTDRIERRLRTLGGSLTRLGATTGFAALASQASALVGALLPVTGILSAIPGAASIAAAGIGTLFVGFFGIGDAIKESFKQVSGGAKSVAADTTSLQRAVESANRGIVAAQREVTRAMRDVEDANYGVAQATRSVVAAQRDALEAELDLKEARDQAAKALEDYQSRLQGATLSQERADIALQEARQRLIDLSSQEIKEQFYEAYLTDTEAARQKLSDLAKEEISDSLETRKAKLDIAEAELRLQDAIKSSNDLQKAANKAQEQGIDGNEDVIRAQERVAETTERIADANRSLYLAQRNVADSNQEVADAQEGVILANQQLEDAIKALSKAQETQSGGVSKAAQAMSQLSPAAQRVVRAIVGLKDEWDSLRNTVQEKLFAGIDKEINDVARVSFPTLTKGLGLIAEAFNRVFKEIAAVTKSPIFQGNLAVIFEATAQGVDSLNRAVGPLINGFVNLAAAATPFLLRFIDYVAVALQNFGNFLSSEKGTKKLTAALDRAGKIVGQVFRIVLNLGTALSNVFLAADSGEFLASLERISQRFKEFTQSAEGEQALQEFFTALGRAATALAEIIPKVFDIVELLLNAFNGLPEPVKEATTEFLALSLVFGPLITGLATLTVGAKGFISIVGLLAKGPIDILQGYTAATAGAKSLQAASAAAQNQIKANIDEIGKTEKAIESLNKKAFVRYQYDSKGFREEVDNLNKKLGELKDKNIKITAESDQKGIDDLLKKAGTNAAGSFLGGLGASLALRLAPVLAPAFAGLAALIGPILIATGVAAAVLLAFHFRDEIGRFFTDTLPSFFSDALPKAFAGVLEFFKSLPGQILFAMGFALGFLYDAGRDTIQGLLNGINFLWPAVREFFITLSGNVLGFIGDVLKTLYNKGKDLIQGLLDGARWVWDNVVFPFISGRPDESIRALGDLLKALYQKGKDLIQGMFNGISEIWPSVYNFFKEAPGKIVEAIGDLGRTLFDAGRNLVLGIFNGVKSAFNQLADAGGVAFEIFKKGFEKGADIRSPSRVMMTAGQLLMRGLDIGISSYLPQVLKTAKGVAASVTEGLSASSPEFAATLASGDLSFSPAGTLATTSPGSQIVKNYNLTLNADYTTSESPEENFRRMEILSLPYDLKGV